MLETGGDVGPKEERDEGGIPSTEAGDGDVDEKDEAGENMDAKQLSATALESLEDAQDTLVIVAHTTQ